jgi:hypothetical protein
MKLLAEVELCGVTAKARAILICLRAQRSTRIAPQPRRLVTDNRVLSRSVVSSRRTAIEGAGVEQWRPDVQCEEAFDAHARLEFVS